jgi:hypothetical protein
VPKNYEPPAGSPYKVQDGDSWGSLAGKCRIDAWELIRYNYPGMPVSKQQAAKEVNWYLQEYVGCKVLTADSKNYCFSASANPGKIYLPVEPPPQPTPVPVLNTIAERRQSILQNTPGVIPIKESSSATPYPSPWYSLDKMQEVTANDVAIEQAARRNNLDPDFVRAIVWMESTHGWYDRVDPKNETIRPMNVHARLWSELGISRTDLTDPVRNIEAGVYILAQIWSRTPDPTVEKVATLYNKLGATEVNGYGKTVAKYTTQKPWRQVQKAD